MKREPNGADPDTEIKRLEREIAATDKVGLPLPDRIETAHAALRDDAEFFERHMFDPVGYRPGEALHFQLKSLRGALAVFAGDELRRLVRKRVEQRYQAEGGTGLSAAEREKRLAELRRELRVVRARRELAWRQEEAAGAELAERADADGELFLLADAALQRIAEGKEAA